jgi:glycosyltransferase involved in cell wall biosynthesis
MKVAVDCHMVAQRQAGDAGNARYAASLARALAATAAPGDAVVALVAHAGAEAELEGAETMAVPAANAPRLAWAAPRALARAGADVAVFTYISPRRAPCPIVLAVHDASFRLWPEWLDPRTRAVLGRLVPPSAERAALVLALSETARRDLAAALGLAPERVRVVSPFPAPAFRPREDAGERVRRRFGLERYCLAVGDVGPRKNLEVLGQAIPLVRTPGLEFAVVGRHGHGGRDILARAGARWLGPVDDDLLADLYSAATATCSPSLYEGFGLTVIEAMACGSPVVAVARGAVPEVADGAAVLVEPEAEAIASGIRAVLDGATARRLRSAGPERAAAYTVDGMGRAAWAAMREAASR